MASPSSNAISEVIEREEEGFADSELLRNDFEEVHSQECKDEG